MLKEALDSVRVQSLSPCDVAVGIDPYRLGEVGNMNRLIDATDSEWIAFLHDDDIWHPDHLLHAMEHQDADVIVSDFDLVGRPSGSIEPFHDDWNDLRRTNWFPPSAVVVRRSVFGRWTDPPQQPPRDWVDWANWRRLLDAGARFTRTHHTTLQYRFLGGNGSWSA